MNRNDAGFTLLEMVCVMAIVALLAAFAMPSPHTRTSRAGVERLAREARLCICNLGQEPLHRADFLRAWLNFD